MREANDANSTTGLDDHALGQHSSAVLLQCATNTKAVYTIDRAISRFRRAIQQFGEAYLDGTIWA